MPGPSPSASPRWQGPDEAVIAGQVEPAWRQPAMVGALAAGMAGYTAIVDPNRSSSFPFCPLKLLTGVDCPFCGSLRATHSLLHGHLAAAVDHNLLFVLAVPVAVVMWATWLASAVGWPVRRPRLPAGAWWAVGTVAALFMAARNLPVTPLHWLASS